MKVLLVILIALFVATGCNNSNEEFAILTWGFDSFEDACKTAESEQKLLLIYFDKEPFKYESILEKKNIIKIVSSDYIYLRLNVSDSINSKLLKQTGNTEPLFVISNSKGYFINSWEKDALNSEIIENLEIGNGP